MVRTRLLCVCVFDQISTLMVGANLSQVLEKQLLLNVVGSVRVSIRVADFKRTRLGDHVCVCC